jgi:hypothetical protein
MAAGHGTKAYRQRHGLTDRLPARRYSEILDHVFALREEAVHRATPLGFATESRKVMLIAANPAPATEVSGVDNAD